MRCIKNVLIGNVPNIRQISYFCEPFPGLGGGICPPEGGNFNKWFRVRQLADKQRSAKPLQEQNKIRFRGRVARQRSAKPFTAVRICSGPLDEGSLEGGPFLV